MDVRFEHEVAITRACMASMVKYVRHEYAEPLDQVYPMAVRVASADIHSRRKRGRRVRLARVRKLKEACREYKKPFEHAYQRGVGVANTGVSSRRKPQVKCLCVRKLEETMLVLRTRKEGEAWTKRRFYKEFRQAINILRFIGTQ